MFSKRKIWCGDVPIGGDAPVSIQSMTNTDTRDVAATVAQIHKLQDAGCQIVRCAVPDETAARTLTEIRRQIRIPLVADIHFDFRLAILAMENGADKIRINPGNLGGAARAAEVAACAKARGIPIRIGVNAGSLEKDLLQQYGGPTPQALAESALRNIEIMEKTGFEDLVVSLKSSDVRLNFDAHRLAAAQTDHPFHIGITESGTAAGGSIRSAIGTGALLLAGIGDTLRISLTGDPVREVLLAQEVLKSLGLQAGAIHVVACPTCGRCRVDLEAIALAVEERIKPLEAKRRQRGLRPLTVAVMGCAVNGPGEAAHADIGVACGNGKGVLFRQGKQMETVAEEEIIEALEKGITEL